MGSSRFSPYISLKLLGISISPKSSNPEKKRRCKGTTIFASLFGVGAHEALVIGVVALLVFGPKGVDEDNSLQAVWSCSPGERLISVDVFKDGISIFDSGPGMDSREANSIDKWGKIGASMHRSHKSKAIGGKPPYLMPCFGMFGYGAPYACMHLGRRTLLSSKTKQPKKVLKICREMKRRQRVFKDLKICRELKRRERDFRSRSTLLSHVLKYCNL